jgi:hypothetical protein
MMMGGEPLEGDRSLIRRRRGGTHGMMMVGEFPSKGDRPPMRGTHWMTMEGGPNRPPMRKTMGRTTSNESTRTSTKSTDIEATTADRGSTAGTTQNRIIKKTTPRSTNII